MVSWMIFIVVCLGAGASVYTAYSTYVSRHSAATSARIAKHAANEAGAEREVASKAARIAVAASGQPDPGMAVDPERVTGVPEPTSYRVVSKDQPRALTRNGVVVGVEVVSDGAATLYGRGGEAPKVVRPDGTPWDFAAVGPPDEGDRPVDDPPAGPALVVPDALASLYADREPPLISGTGVMDDLIREARAASVDMDDPRWRRLYEQPPAAPEPPDPTQSGAQSWPTGSAPEDPSPSGGDDSPTEPIQTPGIGGGGTSSAGSSGERTGAFSRLSLRRPTASTSLGSTDGGSDD
jgi:hypothetical protein